MKLPFRFFIEKDEEYKEEEKSSFGVTPSFFSLLSRVGGKTFPFVLDVFLTVSFLESYPAGSASFARYNFLDI